ncbi:17.4 kDa class III heat shock protein [Artemisia annua]|uniref:17.4 kDa class III heat shock protein n=1 Tax=Artemisia annua TaxID=35608 RepID=A0A2U1P7W4_ARTAN|nr:17.4 kDa class III heat shock protein [Artemisia annua]
MFDAFYAAHLLNATGIIVVPGSSFGQVTVDEENLLVVKSDGKRKRDKKDEEEEGCKYLLLERRPQKNLTRKFRFPENCNMFAISAKCENGVLKVVVEKLPPPKSKTV